MAAPLRVAVAGMGTVGGGVMQILKKKAPMLARRAGRPIELVACSDLAQMDVPGVSMDGVKFYDDCIAMANEQECDVLVETIGGMGVAKGFFEAGLGKGKNVVTANKALLATHGLALATVAESSGVTIGYEAAIGGGIPCVKGLREGLSANEVQRVHGIINGTCNYILTTMAETGRDFEDVLAEAQAKGYAETPPDLDVDGPDTAHKLCLLASIGFGFTPAYDRCYLEGIRSIQTVDVVTARAMGYKIKLLGIAEQAHGGILQRVHPALVPINSAIGAIDGVINAVGYVGDSVGPTQFSGPGAGREATASAVVADIVDIARGNAFTGVFNQPVGDLADGATATVTDMAGRSGKFFVRLSSTSEAEAKALPGFIESVTTDGGCCAMTSGVEGELFAGVEALGDADANVIRVEEL